MYRRNVEGLTISFKYTSGNFESDHLIARFMFYAYDIKKLAFLKYEYSTVAKFIAPNSNLIRFKIVY